MKQRLGIAAALLSDPKLLLLDEPSNGLDPAGIVAMRETLRQLASSGKTVFVSSHVLGEVQQLADVIGIIAAGRLVREGPIGELLHGEGVVRVRVAPEEIDPPRSAHLRRWPANAAWPRVAGERLADGPDRDRSSSRGQPGPGRGRRSTPRGLETGSDLEQLFLELTRDEAPSGHEGTFKGAAPAGVPSGWGTAGGSAGPSAGSPGTGGDA